MPDATCVPLASAAAPNLLQEELEELFGAIDRAKGQATGFIDKVRVGVGWGGVGWVGAAWAYDCTTGWLWKEKLAGELSVGKHGSIAIDC